MKNKILELIGEGDLHQPFQSITEFSRWLEKLLEIDPKVGMEIGVHHGGSAHWMLECIPGIELYVGVDRKSNQGQKLLEERHNSVKMVCANSTKPRCKRAIESILEGRLLDFLFIDGNHRAGHVQSDWDMYHGLVRPGGLIAFHDIGCLPGPREVFDSVKDSGQWSEEIIATENTPDNYEDDFPPVAREWVRDTHFKKSMPPCFGIGVVCR